MIEELGRVVAGVVAMRRRGEVEEAEQALDDALNRMVGFGTALADELPAEQLIQMLRLAGFSGRDGRVNTDRLVALGTLLQEGGELAAARGEIGLRDGRRLKALEVLLLASMQERLISDQVRDAVEALAQELSNYDLSLGMKERLWLHYERLGRFSRAEDWLFELLDDERAGPGIVAAGIAFYERLGRQTDAALETGGLSREEVEAGLEQLRQRAGEDEE
jgi:hypothetical protein